MPSDIDPQSGFRLPLPKREALDDAGKRAYDRASTPGKTIVGLRGPAGIHLYSSKTVEAHNTINQHLRFGAGFVDIGAARQERVERRFAEGLLTDDDDAHLDPPLIASRADDRVPRHGVSRQGDR